MTSVYTNVLTYVVTPCNDSYMNTATAAAKSLTDVRWMQDGNVAQFQNVRLFGVTDGAGRWASWDGVRPMSYDRKSTAVEIATTATELAWIEAL